MTQVDEKYIYHDFMDVRSSWLASRVGIVKNIPRSVFLTIVTLHPGVSSNFKLVFHVDAKGYFASCRVLKDLGLRWSWGDPEMEYNQAAARQRRETSGRVGKMCNG